MACRRDRRATAQGLGPHHLNKVWPFPKAYNHGRDVTDSRHLAHADLSACPAHRFKVLPDVAQRSDSVSPRAHEDKPATIEAPEVWPLKLSPRFFKPRKRPPSFYMPLFHRGNPPQTSCDVATGVEYPPAQLGDLTANAVVENEGAQAGTEEPEVGYVLGRQLRYPRPDVLAHPKDKLRKDRRVGVHKDSAGGLVRHHAIALPAEPAYREARPLDRGTERANEDYRGGSLRESSEFFTPVQRMLHARSTLPRATPSPRTQTGVRPPRT
jgi:hypothetical protein